MRIVKTFEDFDTEFNDEIENMNQQAEDIMAEEGHDEQREHGFYWVVIKGNMTIAEWVHDEEAGDFWLAHGEEESLSNEDIDEILKFIEPPLSDEYDEDTIEANWSADH